MKLNRRTVRRFFFPEKCKVCGRIVPLEKDFCSCYNYNVNRINEVFCDHCGQSDNQCICSEKEIHLSHITAPFFYNSFIKRYIHAFKFHKKKNFGNVLGTEMAERFLRSYPNIKADLVTFVPLSEKSLLERGYNQSEILAKKVSEKLDLPLAATLKKIRETENQHKITASKRKTNLENAFCLIESAELKGKTVILCDDIKTTGNTFFHCSSILFENGVKDVYCLSAAISVYESLPF